MAKKIESFYKLPPVLEIKDCEFYTKRLCLHDSGLNRSCKTLVGCSKKWEGKKKNE